MKLCLPQSGVQHSTYILPTLLFLSVGCLPAYVAGRNGGSVLSYGILKKMSLQQLMRIEVTSVSKTPEKLAAAASAVQVIMGEDIRRSGATPIPEALRLAENLQVTRVNASQWAISAGGFNNVLADSAKSDFHIQAYYDQTWRDLLNAFAENLRTTGIDCFNGMLTCRF
jgi:outer membrane receptor protein involved in Fe transport